MRNRPDKVVTVHCKAFQGESHLSLFWCQVYELRGVLLVDIFMGLRLYPSGREIVVVESGNGLEDRR